LTYHLATRLKILETEKKTVTTGLLLPELRLNVYGASFGSLNDAVEPVLPTQFLNPTQLYRTRAFDAGLMWQIPLGNLIYGGGRKSYDARISLQQTENDKLKANVNAEILEARTAVIATREQIQIAEEGNQLAEMALTQSIQRQELGIGRPFEILQAQEIYITGRLDYSQAVTDYNKA
jgi:outer membrane protein TolC